MEGRKKKNPDTTSENQIKRTHTDTHTHKVICLRLPPLYLQSYPKVFCFPSNSKHVLLALSPVCGNNSGLAPALVLILPLPLTSASHLSAAQLPHFLISKKHEQGSHQTYKGSQNVNVYEVTNRGCVTQQTLNKVCSLSQIFLRTQVSETKFKQK